jgi:hypothetical protein
MLIEQETEQVYKNEKKEEKQRQKQKEKQRLLSLRKKTKFKNSLRIRYEYKRPFLKKFKLLKKQITSKNQNPEKGYNCIFKYCDKIFPNYTRWMLHYRVHVINKILNFLYLYYS